jgi:PAS domain S-box-containing protein
MDIFINDLRRDGSVSDYEIILKRKDGSPVYVSTSSHFYYDMEGRIAGIEGIVRDITARKSAEDMFNRAFFDNPCPMSISDIKTGKYLEVNTAWLETLEFRREDVINRTSIELNIFNDPAERDIIVDSIIRTGRIADFETMFISSSGKRLNGIFYGEVIDVGGRKMLLSIVMNVTGQRRAEKALAASEERFRRLAENAPDVIYRMSIPGGVYEYVNPSAEKVLGYTPDEIYASPRLVAKVIHPEWRDYFRQQWNNMLKGDIPLTYEYMIITKQGETRWLHQRNMVIRDNSGAIAAIEGIITDITERKAAENDLRFKNAVLRAEQEVSPDGILIVDHNGKIILYNRQFTVIWAIPEDLMSRGSDNDVLQNILSVVADPDGFLSRIRYLYAHREEINHEEIRFRDGRIIERYSASITGEDGEYFGRVWYFRDITERKQAEEKLKAANDELIAVNEEIMAINEEFEAANQELITANTGLIQAQDELKLSESKYRALVENLSAGMIVYTPEYGIIFYNPLAAAILGLKEGHDGHIRDDGRWFVLRGEDSDPAGWKYPVNHVLFSGEPVKGITIKGRSAEGRDVWLLCDAYPVTGEYGEIKQVVCTFVDITGRVLAEGEINRLKNYVTSIIDSDPDIVVGLDMEMNITLLNRKAGMVSGMTAAEAYGHRLKDVLGDFARWIEPVISPAGDNKPSSRQGLVIDRDGERRSYDIVIYPLVAPGAEGSVLRIIDTTDTVRKEEQFRQAQKMETVGTLASGLAHNFNNVLSGIVGTASLIKHMLEKDKTAGSSFINYIDIIDRSGKRAAEMVQQLLALSRKSGINLSRFDLNESVRNVMQICRNTFDKSVEIITEYAPDKAMITGDPSQVEQVLLNLCLNAAHAMTIMRSGSERTGGTLSVAVRNIIADRYFCSGHPGAAEGRYWMVTHSDTGVGIRAEHMNKIFDPFFSTKESEFGTGLGLAMVYNIINQHNGFITVYSEPGAGSTFNIYLPEPPEADEKAVTVLESPVEKGEGVILVIDDEETVRFIAESLLKECGYDVVLAGSGREGIEIFRRMKDGIKAVLLDMAMPGMSGKDVYPELKKIRPDVKVLLASGFRQDGRVQETLELGIQDFIQKPYSIAELSKKIRRVIQ